MSELPWQSSLPYACHTCGARFLFDSIAAAAVRGWGRTTSLRGHRCYIPDAPNAAPVLGTTHFRPSTARRFAARRNVR